MASMVQIGVICKDTSLLASLKKSALKAGDADLCFVSPNEASGQLQFSTDKYLASLRTKSIGQSLLVAASIPSTQTMLHQHFARFPDGVIFVTDTQTSGKGRGSNAWVSPMGCLMFSTYKRLNISGEHLPFVQYVVSLAIVRAIQATIKPLVEEVPLDVRIKWPNDIYANSMKIGGILCQSVYREGAFHVIIGAGLNVNNSKPTTCLASLISDLGRQEGPGIDVSREALLANIAQELEDLLQTLREHGFRALKPQYLSLWLHTGQDVVLQEAGDAGTKYIPLKIQGISDAGYLIATDEGKETYELHPDGNSLDFFAGLVRHKVVHKAA